jgi:nucleoid DNA-binding protein
MGKISINELAVVLIERKNLKKKSASTFVNELFYLIQKGLEQDKSVKVKGLGTFKIIDVDDRESVNVNNGERVLIEGHSKITFTPDALMKELVNKPFSQFETVVLNEGVDFEQELEQEPEPDLEQEPAQKPEMMSEPEVDDDVDASMAPLVDFVTDNEPQISPESESEPEPEPEPEPEFQPIPNPILEQEPESVPEPVQEPEPESIQETEPIPEPESEISSTERETSVSEEEPVEHPSEEPNYLYEEDNSGGWKKWVIGILACCICFAGGYYFGSTYGGFTPMAESKVEADKSKVEAVKSKAETPKPEQTKSEAIKSEPQEPKASESNGKAESEAKPEVKPEPKPEPQPVAQSAEEVSLDQYEKMDVRIRTGAYRIVGTDHVEKVKATDNLARICKRTIGPGMECYLEVYNGIKGDADLKVGQEIKIPKLVHKKKKVQK